MHITFVSFNKLKHVGEIFQQNLIHPLTCFSPNTINIIQTFKPVLRPFIRCLTMEVLGISISFSEPSDFRALLPVRLFIIQQLLKLMREFQLLIHMNLNQRELLQLLQTSSDQIHLLPSCPEGFPLPNIESHSCIGYFLDNLIHWDPGLIRAPILLNHRFTSFISSPKRLKVKPPPNLFLRWWFLECSQENGNMVSMNWSQVLHSSHWE